MLEKIFKKIVKRAFFKGGYSINKIGSFDFFQLIMDAFLKKNNELFFIQIGANDGKSFDPIYEFVINNHKNVRGILLEPLEDYFMELKRNYKGYSNVTILNLAVHNSNKEMIIHRVDPKKIERNEQPEWTKGIASFNGNHHELSGTPKEVIIKQNVKCISLEDLLRTHQVAKIDLLQIDTEGYDSEIILNIDFKAIKPKVIHFEHGLEHEIMSKEEFTALADLLHNNGYDLFMDQYDCTAYQRNILIDL